jgi:hypothetical protein
MERGLTNKGEELIDGITQDRVAVGRKHPGPPVARCSRLLSQLRRPVSMSGEAQPTGVPQGPSRATRISAFVLHSRRKIYRLRCCRPPAKRVRTNWPS